MKPLRKIRRSEFESFQLIEKIKLLKKSRIAVLSAEQEALTNQFHSRIIFL